MCEVRRRPMPGSAPADSLNSFGLALDLRRNALQAELAEAGGELFGNAAWCIHVHGGQLSDDAAAGAVGVTGTLLLQSWLPQ